MLRISITNFGPIKVADITLTRFLVLIGPQASGKSTLAKLAFFFLQVRDELMEFVISECREPKKERRDIVTRFTKILRLRFTEFFGPARAATNTTITCRYASDVVLTVGQLHAKLKYVEPQIGAQLGAQIDELVNGARRALREGLQPTALLSSTSRIATEQIERKVIEFIRQGCNQIFGFDKELLFVPAGRSVLSTLSDQMQLIHPHSLDYPMRRFVDTVNRTRGFFDKSLDDLVTAKRALTSDPVHLTALREAKEFVYRVLRGEYRYDKEGGKIYVDERNFTKINYASSGQQEAVWILLSFFLLVLENAKALITVEEPEAHLFPDAQKDMIEFIAYVFNRIQCDVVITTHSPYILARINNLVYAHELCKKFPEKVGKVIDSNVHLDPNFVSGYYVGNGRVQPLKGKAGPFLRNEMLDGVSDQMNTELDALLAIERGQSDAGKARGARS